MLKMRERSASRFADCKTWRALRRGVDLLFGVAITATPSSAHAAARRIALIHAEPALTRSVDLALYPWDIDVVVTSDDPPQGNTPDATADAEAISKRQNADAVAWIARGGDSPTLWFFDAATRSLHSHPLPRSGQDDAAEFAAVALTLKTFVRGTPWESRLPIVARERAGSGWETKLELDLLARVPLSGASGEPRFGLWASEWYGSARLMWGAALGASAGLGMTFDDGRSRGSVQDLDLRADVRARLRLARHFALEPRLGGSAHAERAQVTTTAPASTQTLTRVNPSVDVGLFLGWEPTGGFVWAIGVEALDSLRYQRWIAGQDVVFAPSPVWIQAGSSLAWSFR